MSRRAVDFVGVLRQRLAQQLALGRVVRRLESAQQLVEGVQDLFGELLADLVLELAAVFKQRGEPLARGRVSSRVWLSSSRSAAEIGRPGGLRSCRATRKSSQPELSPRGADTSRSVAAIEEQSGGHASLAQQPLHPAVRAWLRAAWPGHERSKSCARVEHPHEELPRRRAVRRVSARARRSRARASRRNRGAAAQAPTGSASRCVPA